ncbi:MAG: HAD family hydrolase [Patescibacteria group bacterium]|nr:HAD family hydrolase [Patescibacteria group bacterium]
MVYKLLALDVDGTLVIPHTNTPTKKVVDAVIQAKNHVHVSLVTARAWNDVEPLIHLLKLEDCYHVIENGTKVIAPQKKIIHDKRLSIYEAKRIVEIMKELSNEIAFCIEGKWVNEIPHDDSFLVSTISVISYDRTKAEKLPTVLQNYFNTYQITVGAH